MLILAGCTPASATATVTATKVIYKVVTMTQTVTAAPAKSVVLILTPEELYNPFKTNKAAATLVYKGSLIQVQGVVGVVASTLSGWDVTLYKPSTYNIECYFDASSANDVGGLANGQTVTIQGTCDGTSTLGDPKLGHCRIVQ